MSVAGNPNKGKFHARFVLAIAHSTAVAKAVLEDGAFAGVLARASEYVLVCRNGVALDDTFLLSQTVKRRAHGRNKKGRGHVKRVRCASTGKAIPKDKAIKRFVVRNIVDASSMRDIRDASAYDSYALPKLYIKQYYCVEAAVHQRIVRSRSRTDRRIREPPQRFQRH